MKRRLYDASLVISVFVIASSADALLSLAVTQPENRWTGTWQTGVAGILFGLPLFVIAYVTCWLLLRAARRRRNDRP
jgi:hypothetical protein